MLNFFIAIFTSTLPRRYRSRFYDSFHGAAITSGILETLFALGFYIQNYFAIFGIRADQLTHMILFSGRENITTLDLNGAHVSALMEYIFRPISLVLAYFVLEGMVRFIAVLSTGEIVPTLPLALLAWIHGCLISVPVQSRFALQVGDDVQVGLSPEFDLRIASSHPKENWHDLMTIGYQNRFYEVSSQEQGSKPRPFIYNLRLRPESKIIRGIVHYNPTRPEEG